MPFLRHKAEAMRIDDHVRFVILNGPQGAAHGIGCGGTGGGDNLPLDFPEMPLDAVTEAVYAAIPKKLGDREYWSQWAKDVAVIAERLSGDGGPRGKALLAAAGAAS